MAIINKNVIILTNASNKTLTFRNIYVKPYIQPKKTSFNNKNDSSEKGIIYFNVKKKQNYTLILKLRIKKK